MSEEKHKNVKTSGSLPRIIHSFVKRYAEKYGISQNAVIIFALKRLMEEHDEK